MTKHQHQLLYSGASLFPRQDHLRRPRLPSDQVKALMRSNVQLRELALSLGLLGKPSDFR